MNRLKETLATLNPPVKHFFEYRGEDVLLTLLDPGVPAKVSRLITRRTVMNTVALNVMVLYAVNELRVKGSHVPLQGDTVLIGQKPSVA
ncbi:hypothetical protein [Pseudomonas oryzihabitans]|uniref:hypothetical protein n=1 Tax=Pseudomonas oryzihabitans TaxID=47885 RepID=UPI0028962726|nr:hypothetical protein [Pseudomonas oryzihabitans]MDT3721004.1 hypothetical protein [Pseudomonas oryzihabitans]